MTSYRVADDELKLWRADAVSGCSWVFPKAPETTKTICQTHGFVSQCLGGGKNNLILGFQSSQQPQQYVGGRHAQDLDPSIFPSPALRPDHAGEQPPFDDHRLGWKGWPKVKQRLLRMYGHVI